MLVTLFKNCKGVALYSTVNADPVLHRVPAAVL